MRAVRTILVCLLSAGWLLPAWLALCSWYAYERSAVLVGGRWRAMDSFPDLRVRQDAMTIAAIWLAAAICFWVWFVVRQSGRS